MDMLSKPAFWRIYYENRLDLEDGDVREATQRWDAMLDRIFGPRDAELRQRLFPRIAPPETFDEADVAEATRVAGDLSQLDDGLRAQLLRQVAIRRRAPPNVVLRLPFPEDYVWQIELDLQAGIYHSLAHPGCTEPLTLGSDDAHFCLPILRWGEYERIRLHLRPEQRLLLAATCWLAEGEDGDQVAAMLRGDWLEAAVVKPSVVDELVERLLVASELRWRRDPELGWVNDGRHSLRNPDDGEWRDVDGFRRFAEFARAAGAWT
jgi:hypothetical protein